MLYYFALLLPCFICLAWAFALIGKWRINNNAQNIVAVNLIVLAFCSLSFTDLLLQTDSYTWRYVQNAIYMSTVTLVFPLFTRYFRLLTNGAKLQWWNNIIFLPTVIVLITMAITHIAMGHNLSVSYVRDFLYNNLNSPSTTIDWLNFRANLDVWISAIVLIQELYLVVYAFISLRRYRRDLNNFFSNNKDKGVGINYVMLFSLIAYFVLMAVSTIVPIEVFKGYHTFIIAITLLYAGVLNTLASCAFKAKHTAADMTILIEKIDGQVGEIELDTNNDSKRRGYPSTLQTKFNKLIDDEKIFLKPDLSIDEICRRLAVNRNYIVRMIDDQYGVSFFDYINSRRIEYAKALLTAQPDIIEHDIAGRTGFVNDDAFSRIFRQHTCQTPRNWRQKNTKQS